MKSQYSALYYRKHHSEDATPSAVAETWIKKWVADVGLAGEPLGEVTYEIQELPVDITIDYEANVTFNAFQQDTTVWLITFTRETE